MNKRRDLDRLTRRWRDRHDARLAQAADRPRANGGREALARRAFPFKEMTPSEYADRHGDAMAGFTYDEESYADPELDAWLLELGRILRERREAGRTAPKMSSPKASAPKRAAGPKAPKAASGPDG